MDLLDSLRISAFVENAEGSAGVRWKKWLKQFELWLKVKNIHDPDQQLNYLLYYGKEDIQKVVDCDAEVTDYVSDVYQRAIRKLNEYYLPKVSRIYERSVFRNMTKEAGEKIESFVLRLKKQGEFCDYADQLEFMIVDQIVEKMQENALKKKILKGNFNLAEIQCMIATHEVVEKQIKSYESGEVVQSEVNAIMANQNQNQNNVECYACGKRGHRSKDPNCPALHKQCSVCKRIGHFSGKCNMRFQINQRYENKPYSRPFQQQNARHYQPSYSRSFDNNGNDKRFVNNRRSNFQAIKQNTNGSSSSTTINNIDVKSENDDDVIFNLEGGQKVQCIVGGVQLELVLDTGSTADIIGENDWKNLQAKVKVIRNIEKSDKSFRAYGAKEKLKVLGRVLMKVEANDKEVTVWFYIIENGQRSLLSGGTAEKLNLIQFTKLRGNKINN